MLEHGAYTLLLDACYDREQFPTEEDALDWCWARSDAEIAAVKFVLSKFFTLEDGRYIQKRVMEELELYHEKATRNSEIAREREQKRKIKAQNVHETCESGHVSSPNHKPLTKNQEPLTTNQEPRTKNQNEEELPSPAKPSPRAATVAKSKSKDPAPTTAIWEAYAESYHRRYGTDPVRNAKVNGQLAQLLQRLGADEAPAVAAWFVGHSNRFYVQKMHSVDCLLADAEKLRTEWATGRRVTATAANEADRMQEAGDMWGRLIDQHAEADHGNP